MLVAAVDQHVALGQVRQNLLDQVVHGLPRLDHHHDLAGFFDFLDQVLDRVAADELLPFGPPFHERIDLLGRAIEYRDGIAAALDVESQILAHDGEPDETEISFVRHRTRVWRSGFSVHYVTYHQP